MTYGRPGWGVDDPPLSDVWPREPLGPDRLPSVVRARAAGWFLAPDAPAWCFLPAVWPTAARAWVPDRSVRAVRMECDGVVLAPIPWSAWDHAEAERDVAALLADAGVPPRPVARLWLLRPPPGQADVDATVERLAEAAARDGVPLGCSAAMVALASRELARWFAPAC